jgi:hypothetical protein
MEHIAQIIQRRYPFYRPARNPLIAFQQEVDELVESLVHPPEPEPKQEFNAWAEGQEGRTIEEESGDLRN